MKKFIFTFAIVLAISASAAACDICGCGAGNNYIGILPDFYKHIIGIRYRYNSLHSHIGVNGANTYLTTQEKYKIAELWGGWTFNNKWRLMLTLPYSVNEKINQAGAASKSGMGDITVAGYYQLMNKKKTVLKDKLFVQSLWLGGGVKLATGEYNPVDKNNTNQNTNLFQLGTASTDLIIAAMYDARLMDAGINFSTQYKINTGNKYDYRYGNKLNLATQVYYKIKFNNLTIAPNAGLQYETSSKDFDTDMIVDLSGGRLLSGGFGVETNFKKIAIGANWQTPLSQNLGEGFIKANNRMMLHVAFAF
jgi:hypothetical protein